MIKQRKKSGFTMAELLIVVGIISVLSAVAFVAVTQYQRSMERLERDSVAREIFVAAQNHLTMAESQGFLGLDTNSSTVLGQTEDETKGIYYFSVYRGSGFSSGAPATMLDLMLPFGAIDETVRAGGSYLICYQKEPAIVMDVFYCSTDSRYGYDLTGSDYSDLRDNWREGKENARKNYNGKVLGWYGGAEASTLEISAIPLKEPEIEIENAEKLRVIVTDTNTSGSLQLIITGVTSGTKKAFTLRSTEESFSINASPDSGRIQVIITDEQFDITLDDITAPGLHFADLKGIKTVNGASVDSYFLPGEDVTVQAVAFDNTKLTNVAYSAEKRTNSLFEKIETAGGVTTASINNFRHLENLDEDVSNVDNHGSASATKHPLNLQNAVQTTDLNWPAFTSAIRTANGDSNQVKVYRLAEISAAGGDDCLAPVSPAWPLTYDGGEHRITQVKVNYAANNVDETNPNGAAGLFGAPSEALSVSNLVWGGFESTGAGDAGARAGALPAGSTVKNVLAYNSEVYAQATNIISTSGNAGGLVGCTQGATGGSVSVTESAAALYVQSQYNSGNAGGLIGMAANTGITACYSGGHTLNGVYSANTDPSTASANGLVNIIGGANAGGLIGSATGSTGIDYCYSTCSVGGANAGGLVGSAEGNAISNSYAAGLVRGTANAGTFLGTGTIAGSGDYYVAGINGDMLSGSAVAVPFAITEEDTNTMYTAPEGESPSAFPAENNRGTASPYDAALITAYEGRYLYLTVDQMGYSSPAQETSLGFGGTTQTDSLKKTHLSRHYGDWQAPIADSTLLIKNAERLSASVSMPASQLENYRQAWGSAEFALLIKGESSGELAYLPFAVKENTGADAGTNPCIASLLPGAVIPGLYGDSDTEAQKAEKLNNWLSGADIAVAVTPGETEGADGTVALNIDFDAITRPGGHFAQLFKTFIPGENLTVAAAGGFTSQAVLKSIIADTTKPKWTAYGSAQTGNEATKDRVLAARTNSLFDDPDADLGDTVADGSDMETDASKAVAAIANIRHLENLDGAISGVNSSEEDQPKLVITTAKQVRNLSAGEKYRDGTDADLSWQGFISALGGEGGDDPTIRVYPLAETEDAEANDLFLPVNPAYALAYDGQGHGITGIVVDTDDTSTGDDSTAAGLFGKPSMALNVANLALIDFAVTGSGDTGALAGKLILGSVKNVVAYNTAAFDKDDSGKPKTTITSTGGSAGGLIGSMPACIVERCAAALVVKGNTAAGGLIGATSGGTLKASYSGGHTDDGQYTGDAVGANYNVTATAADGVAGGVVGNTGTATIEYCYSTCSVTGATAGGLVGATDGNITGGYATGLVRGTSTEGAFVGKATGTPTFSGWYFDIINERVQKDASGNVTGFEYLPALGSGESAGVTALDADATAYNAFTGAQAGWKNAAPYDGKLNEYYSDKYNLRTVAKLYPTGTASGIIETATETAPADFVATHYGDWPAPEIFVINAGSAPSGGEPASP